MDYGHTHEPWTMTLLRKKTAKEIKTIPDLHTKLL